MEAPMFIGNRAIVPVQPLGRRDHWALSLNVTRTDDLLEFRVDGVSFVVHEEALAALLRERAYMQARLQEARDGDR